MNTFISETKKASATKFYDNMPVYYAQLTINEVFSYANYRPSKTLQIE